MVNTSNQEGLVQFLVTYFKLNHFVCLIILTTFFISCRSGYKKKEFYNNDGKLIIQEWYDENSLKSSITFLDDTHNDYISVSYYEDGRLMDSAKYINDTVDGLRKFYEANSELMHFENYKNGLLNGFHKAIYSNGITSFGGYRLNGYKVGEWKFHYSDGRPITYEYYDSTGKIKYFRKYNEEGEAVKVSGSGLISIYPENKSILVSDTLIGYVEAAIPPACKIILSIEEAGNGQKPDNFFVTELKSPKIEWNRKFGSAGKKNLVLKINIKDLKSGKEEEYIAEQKINVKAD